MGQLHTNGVVILTKDISWVWIANGSKKEIKIIGTFEKPEGGTARINITIYKAVTPKADQNYWILSGKISEEKLITINYSETELEARYVLTDAPKKPKAENPFKGTIFDNIWPFK